MLCFQLAIFRTSNSRGWGVKTLQKIKKGTFVMEYVGEVRMILYGSSVVLSFPFYCQMILVKVFLCARNYSCALIDFV